MHLGGGRHLSCLFSFLSNDIDPRGLVPSSGETYTEFRNIWKCQVQNLIHDSHTTHDRRGLESFEYNGATTPLDLYFVLSLIQPMTALATLAAITLLDLPSNKNSRSFTGSRSQPLLS